jgi:hypothetical protein
MNFLESPISFDVTTTFEKNASVIIKVALKMDAETRAEL